VDEEREKITRRACIVPKIKMEDGWLVKVNRFPYEPQTERVGIELKRPIRVGPDGSDMMDSNDFGHVCLRACQVAGPADRVPMSVCNYPSRDRSNCTFLSRFCADRRSSPKAGPLRPHFRRLYVAPLTWALAD
jgi:hypothetical protein